MVTYRGALNVVAVAAAAMLGLLMFAGPAQSTQAFDDVGGKEFFGPAVGWMRTQGLTTGVGGTEAQPSPFFEPFGPVDRAQLGTFMWRMAGSPEPTLANDGFTDTADDAYYTKAVRWLRQEGYTTGIGGTEQTASATFGPHDPVDRAQAITFLWRYGGQPGPYGPHGFRDVSSGPPPTYFEAALRWAKAEGITTGYGGSDANPSDVFEPFITLSRGEMATLVWRYAGFPAPDEAGCLAEGTWPCEDETAPTTPTTRPPTTRPPTTTTTSPPTTTTTTTTAPPPPGGLADPWASDLVKDLDRQWQFLEVELETDLAEGGTFTVDLSEAEQGAVSYTDCQNDAVLVNGGSGVASIAVTAGTSAVVTYTAGDGNVADDTIGIVLDECVDADDESATYLVTWTRQDTGGTATTSFEVDEADDLFMAFVSNLPRNAADQGQMADVRLGQGLETGETITIDLSEAEAGAVAYDGCTDDDIELVLGSGTATILVDPGVSATITFTATADHDPFNWVALDIVSCVDTEDVAAAYEVTWTRVDTGATISASFEVF